MGRLLEALWYARPSLPIMLLRTVFAPILWPLAVIFDVGSGFRRSLFKSGGLTVYRARCPVVIIGNLSVGGTGKTPLVIWLANILVSRGLKVGILTRGYGGRGRGVQRVAADSDPRLVGDEACLLARETRAVVIAAAERSAGAEALEGEGVDLILSDDGLQHYALARDLEVVVVDEARGLGNGWLLPAGPLREGRSRLHSVNWLIWHTAPLTPTDVRDEGVTRPPSGPAMRPDRPHQRLNRRVGDGLGLVLGDSPRCLEMQLGAAEPRALLDGRSQSWSAWRGQTVHALAGIGRPERFFSMLRAAGLSVHSRSFPDHHAFTAADMPADPSVPVLMTSKDAVKCQSFADARLWEVPVAAHLSPEQGEALVADIWALYERNTKPKTGITPGS
jgi:tetraacyldisaccharide 4'-kinase